MYGGRLRGQGTYGCVFQPTLLCSGVKADPNKVGKITLAIDAKTELGIANYLNTIPSSSDYVVVPDSETCVPLTRLKQTDKDIDSCEFTKDIPIEKTIQLTMPWGGQPLGNLNLNPATFNFYKCMEDMLAVGTFLLVNDVCHFDMWGQNFLFLKNTSKPRAIDFGLSFRPSMLTDDMIENRWREFSTDHDTETPEVTLMIGSQMKRAPSDVAYALQHEKPAVQRLATLCEVLPSQWAANLIHWSKQSQSFQQRDWLSCWKFYWPGYDAWGIGAILLEILEVQISIPEFVTSPEWSKRGETVKEVLRGLCRANPVYRLDAAEALTLLTEGSHPLIADGSSGSEWIHAKAAVRPFVPS